MSGTTNTGRVPEFGADFWNDLRAFKADEQEQPAPKAQDILNTDPSLIAPPKAEPRRNMYPTLDSTLPSGELVQSNPPNSVTLDLTGTIANDNTSADQYINLSEFFTNPYSFYLPEWTDETNLIESFEDEIAGMPKWLTKQAFQPDINKVTLDSQIHPILGHIAKKFLGIYTKTPASERIHVCEKFINQFLNKLFRSHGNHNPISQQPFFACFEIALRLHLFRIIVEQEKSELDFILKASDNRKEFPDNLVERENALEALITKNGFFKNPYSNFFLGMIPIELGPHIKALASKNPTVDSAEGLIQCALIEFHLIKPSRFSQTFNSFLRIALGNELLSSQTKHFNNQFIKTGTISQDDFNAVSEKIYNIRSGNGTIQCEMSVKFQMLLETFQLGNKKFPFQTLRNQFRQEKAAQSLLPEPRFLSFLSSAPTRSSENCQKLDNKLATIAWAEQEWISLLPPLEQPIEPPHLELPPEFAMFVPAAIAPSDSNIDQASSSTQEKTIQAPPENPPLQNQAPSGGSDSAPAVNTVRPQQPLPPIEAPVVAPAPQMPEPPRIYSTSLNIPLVSYINIAFAQCLQAANDDAAIWNSLPARVRIDALRHCCYMSNYKGKAEEIAARLFKTVPVVEMKLKELESEALSPLVRNGLSPAFIEKGEAVLKMYYTSNRDKFYQEFLSLPRENLFYHYVYEMAKEAGVHIADDKFGENNWNKSPMMNLSVQALERCLHTNS